MATLIATADGNLTGASTFAAAETGTGALALIRNATTNFGTGANTSATFTITNGKVVDAVVLWVLGLSTLGTLKIDLQKSGVSQASVTVNNADLPQSTVSLLPVPVLFKLSGTVTGDGTSTYTIVATTGLVQVQYYRNTATTSDWTRALRTTTTATPAAGDDLYVLGELTSAGTHNTRTVTMDSTAATAYGNGSVNSTTVSGGGIRVANYGTLAYGTSASTNYILRVNGDLEVFQFGTLNVGSSGSEIPRSSTAVLEFQMASATGDFGLLARNGSTVNIAGLSRTSGKNVVQCKLTADNVLANTLTTATGGASAGSLTANVAADPGGTSLLASGFTDNTTASATHGVGFGGPSLTNTIQTVTAWLARGSGTNNRYVRVLLGNNITLGGVSSGVYVDVDLQSGTLGTPGALGSGVVSGATIVAVGSGYFVTLTGKVNTVASVTNLWLVSCSALGTTAYTGNTTQCFVFDHVNLVTASSVSDTTLTVDTDTGWLSGDQVCVAATSRTAGECENIVLNANAGASSLVTSLYPDGAPRTLGAITISGTTPTQAEVGLLTRNVKIRSTSTSLWSYVYLEPLATVTASWAEFYYLGTTSTTNKRGIETKDGATTNPRSFTYCSMHDLAYSLYNNITGLASFGVTFSNNVAWNITNTSFYMAGPAPGADWTVSGNLAIKTGSRAFYFGDLSGTVTNNTAVGGGSAGFEISASGSSAIGGGTFSGNAAHAGSFGILFDTVGQVEPTVIDTLTVWRNTTAGVAINNAGSTDNITFTNLTSFGNLRGVYFITSANIFRLAGSANIIAGDTSFATTDGIHCAISGGTLEFDVSNLDMSGSTSIYAPATNQDINFPTALFETYRGVFRNCKFGTSSPVPASLKNFWTPSSYLSFQKYGGTAGDHRTEMTYGLLQTDLSIYHTAAPSLRMTPQSATTSKLESAPKGRGIQVAAASGITAQISVWVRKSATSTGDSASYNGAQPRLIQRANAAIGVASDIVLATASAAIGSWEQLTATTTAPSGDDGSVELIVDCDGTAGWINVDDWQVLS